MVRANDGTIDHLQSVWDGPAVVQGLKDNAFLDRLVQWSRRWCPRTVTDSDGILLDATGAAHLFGGEAALLRDVVQRFSMHGLTARVAMAPTRGAAQALARHAHGTICDADMMLTQHSLAFAVRATTTSIDNAVATLSDLIIKRCS